MPAPHVSSGGPREASVSRRSKVATRSGALTSRRAGFECQLRFLVGELEKMNPLPSLSFLLWKMGAMTLPPRRFLVL